MPNGRLSFLLFILYANCVCVIGISGFGIKCDSVFCKTTSVYEGLCVREGKSVNVGFMREGTLPITRRS